MSVQPDPPHGRHVIALAKELCAAFSETSGNFREMARLLIAAGWTRESA